MKINKNLINIILIMFIILLSVFVVRVDAAEVDSYLIKLTSDKTTLKSGQTITVTLNVSDINIQSGDKGIGAYEGTIDYDTSVFTNMKITGNDKWDTPVENGGKFTSVKSDGVCTSDNQVLLKIELTVKDNANAGNTTIKIKNFKASNGEKTIPTSDVSLTVKIEGTSNQNNTSSENTNNSINNQSATNTQKNSTNITELNKSVATNKIPYAGASRLIVYFALITVVVGIFCYIKYKRTY